MNPKLLDLKPTRYLCPYCGKWHDWAHDHSLGYYGSKGIHFKCRTSSNPNEYVIVINDNFIYYTIKPFCKRFIERLKGKIELSSIVESQFSSCVLFSVPSEAYCFNDCFFETCHFFRRGFDTYINLGFEFEQSEYDEIVKPQEKEPQELEQSITKKKQESVTENKEDTTMNEEKKTTIWQQLYEKSPKENVELAKTWIRKYEKPIKWAVPVVTVYAAYRILNSSKITVENIDNECRKGLGFHLDMLQDKKSLKHLMAFGGLTAAAYAAIKAVSIVDNKSELSVEEVEEGLESVKKASKKFGWIQPKTEALFPLAVSVIIVYVMTQKPAWFEKIKSKLAKAEIPAKIELYGEMIKLFLADKLHIDLENEAETKKFRMFALFAGVVGISVFLYGRKVLGNKAVEEGKNSKSNEKLEAFINQLLEVMKKIMPTAFAGLCTYLVTKNILKEDEIVDMEAGDFFDADFENEEAETSEENPAEEADFWEVTEEPQLPKDVEETAQEPTETIE